MQPYHTRCFFLHSSPSFVSLRRWRLLEGKVEYNSKDGNGKKIRTQLEIDFVANKGNRRYYIQSALSVDDEEKRIQETNSLNRVEDSYRKIVVVEDGIIPWYDEKGILYIGIEEFLLDAAAMDK